MTCKERFQAACEHRAADRVPIDYHSDGPENEDRLKRHDGAANEAELIPLLIQAGVDIFAPSRGQQPDMPLPNIVAMYKAAAS